MPQILKAFIDDSKDATQEKFVIAAGVVGFKDDWNRFNKAWRSTLLKNPAIKYFHASEWRGLKGEFHKFREDSVISDVARRAADAKRNELAELIPLAKLTAISVAIDVEDWKRVKEDHPNPRVIEENPYKLALQHLIYQIAKDANRAHHQIQFICDNDTRSHIYEQVYANFRTKNPQTAKKIGRTLTFANDELVYGIQAADLVAHSVNQVHQQYGLKARGLVPSPEMAAIMSGVHVWDYDYGIALLDAQSQ